ncbi:metalloregulator ArsR/SmtB family transcription factor [Rhodococcus sp. HNM0569]|uniref:metalloregulator ArsR/SmtB family transcription factor n=1 Tax=Rhodococcus sp. HNM0569 TaxID=2716340 RepID=UPI00146C4536|nr:helix-turn-helix transcriptional regulator [Rhodococcus sp. HNM0569]
MTVSPIDPDRAAQAAHALSGPDIDGWARRFELLADPNRLRILHCLHHVESICVSDLAYAVEMTPTALSQALRLLRQSGWVAAEREGRVMHYRLVDDTVHALLHTMGARHGGGHTH